MCERRLVVVFLPMLAKRNQDGRRAYPSLHRPLPCR